jgi:hypothetical protein
MRTHRVQRWLAVGALLALPMIASAQEATVSGTITDTTGGALPGVTVRAVHEASGNSFETVTEERGNYRLAVRVGVYQVTADLPGFAPVTRTVAVLVGQQAVVSLQMGLSNVQESVTVTGESPLLDVTRSSLGGNVDPRQLQELPVNGRNWLDLVLLAPGARGNSVFEVPVPSGGTLGSVPRGDFELNVDGQQITQLVTGSTNDGQPRFSRDAIAEFEFLSSRFDATKSRSSGVMINAITKSGSNTPSGSFSGYFRDDSMNAADFIAKRVLPYQNEQLSATFGGPLQKDKLHFFANYEYERQPRTALYTTQYPLFNRDLHETLAEKKGGGKLDAQFSARSRLTVRGSGWELDDPLATTGGGTVTPSSARGRTRQVYQLMGTLSQVFSNRALNEIRVGYNGYGNTTELYATNPNARFNGTNGPRVLLSGLTAGGESQYPEVQSQDDYSIRDDFTYSFSKGGDHTIKMGAEYLYHAMNDFRCAPCEGELDATNGPTPANIESLFPDLFDVSTWNLTPLSPLSRTWRQPFGTFSYDIPRHTTGFWLQDDWTITPRLTLNLGLRYDLELNAFVNDVEILPFVQANRPEDTNNIAPRLGATFSVDDRTVIRGGFGLYYGTVTAFYHTSRHTSSVLIDTPYDGRADFASNPYNGPAPTYEEALARICTPALEAGCIRRAFDAAPFALVAPNLAMPFSYQTSIGLQRQLGTTMAVEADYVYNARRGDLYTQNVNLTYDPATGTNYPFSDVSMRPYPDFGYVGMTSNNRRSNYHALQTAFTKRFSHGWQASATYTLAGLWDGIGQPYAALGRPSTVTQVPFAVAEDLGGAYSLASSDQRHRAVFNGIWQLRYGFQLSGLYFFGSGERYQTYWGSDLRGVGAFNTSLSAGEARLRPDGTLIPRNNLVGKPTHRVDLRIQRRFPLGRRAGIDGIAEVFNLLNHANYGSYVNNEASSLYGQPQQNAALAFAPRMVQLGFRFTF